MFGSFGELAAFEAGACSDERDEVGRIHRSPPLPDGLDERNTPASAGVFRRHWR
ncbi:hypothetical protein [Streptomyces nodosus]|uniref:hypothetical protein n=1 Tax=Streptomyces nodosus TaxID=40318 RepID=UPI0038076898